MDNPSVHAYIAKQLSQLRSLEDARLLGLEDAVTSLADIQGSILMIGVGKSGIIAQKMCATLNSLSVPSQFLHATEVLHGDLGRVTPKDAVVMISRSGNTDEMVQVAQMLSNTGVPIVTIVNDDNGSVTKYATVSIVLPEVSEVDRYNLVPTASTTQQLIVADAIALSVADRRGFDAERFGATHPAGNLGRRLHTKVEDVMHTDDILRVHPEDKVDTIINAISKGRVGACVVLDSSGTIQGIITDGDLRRMLSHPDHKSLKAVDILSSNPKKIQREEKLFDALAILEAHKISQLVVVSDETYVGIVHIHDCLDAGIV